MPKRNRLSRAVGAINLLPRRLRSRSLTLLLGSQVRFAGTARCASMNWGRSAPSSA